MSEQKILLTPELAAKLLEGNVANRPMGKRYMQSLARAMQRGEWEGWSPTALMGRRIAGEI